MMNPNELTERENYKLLISTIIPRPIAFVTTVNEDGVVNAAPFSFFNIVSSNPPMISVSVQRKAGEQKDTARNIVTKQQFVVHIVDERIVAEVNKTAANLAPDESEIALTNFTLVNSAVVDVPAVAEAKVRFECELVQHVPLGGEDGQSGCDLLIGRVVQYYVQDGLRDEAGHIDPHELNAMSRLAGNDYAKIGELLTIERPQ